MIMWSLTLIYLAALSTSLNGTLQPGDPVARAGHAELQKLRGFAAQPRYGACWSRALEKIHTSCQEFTEETQSKLALAFTHCHLRRSDRPFPECTDSSEVRECTRDMDPIAFHTYTEFFTHAHSICHFLQSERWQSQADSTIHRLTESSAGVAEQLVSTQRIAEDLAEAQSAALKTQEAILRNGEDLKHTLQDSAQGVREVFSQIQDTAREQQVLFSQIFSRVAFLQSFIMSESHTLSSLLYNTLGLCAAFLLTMSRRTAGARLFLFGLVALNVYLERTICRAVLENTDPEYVQMERIALLVGLLRRAMVLLALLVLLYSALRFRDVRQESLEILARLKETQSSLHLALERAESLTEAVDAVQRRMGGMERVKEESRRLKEEKAAVDRAVGELSVILAPGPENPCVSEQPCVSDATETSGFLNDGSSWLAHSAVEIPRRRGRRRSSANQHGSSSTSNQHGSSSTSNQHSASSAFIYSILVEDSQPRYNLRSRRSLSGAVEHRLPEASLQEMHT